MNEYDVYVKMPDGSKFLQQSGVVASSAFEAVRTYLRDEGAPGPASKYTAYRASLNSAPTKQHSPW
jgi:hypothetical protein